MNGVRVHKKSVIDILSNEGTKYPHQKKKVAKLNQKTRPNQTKQQQQENKIKVHYNIIAFPCCFIPIKQPSGTR